MWCVFARSIRRGTRSGIQKGAREVSCGTAEISRIPALGVMTWIPGTIFPITSRVMMKIGMVECVVFSYVYGALGVRFPFSSQFTFLY